MNSVVLRLTAVHFVLDGYGNILAPLVPILIPHLGMSLTMVGILTMCFQLAASVAQFGFGYLADRSRPRLLVVLGPVISIAFLSLIGLSGSVEALAAILIVGGLGAAAFHPAAAAVTHRLSGGQPGLAMSIYLTGGSIGFALGPLLFAPFVQRFGLPASPALAIPGLLVVLPLLLRVPALPRAVRRHGAGLHELRPHARPLTLLYLIVVLRTLASLGIATFTPVMLTRRGMTLEQAAMVIALFLFASGVGGLMGGPAADRFGARRVIVWTLIASWPFLAVAPLLHGPAFAFVLAIGGFFLQSALPVNVTFGQSFVTGSAATVSSLMMGVGWGSGGVLVPLVGYAGDLFGLEATLMMLAVLPLAAAACAAPLPARASPITSVGP